MGGPVEFSRASGFTENRLGKHELSTRMYVQYARRWLDGLASIDDFWEYEPAQGWFEPHLVYVIHYPEVRLFKARLMHAATSRIASLKRIEGELVEAYRVPNRWVAKMLEGGCLLMVNEARVEPRLRLAQDAGATEFWRDNVVIPPLANVLLSVRGGDAAPGWSISISRNEEETRDA